MSSSKKWAVSSKRKREIWRNSKTFQLRVIYWDINDERGLAWLLEKDRIGYPESISFYDLTAGGWKKVGV